MSCETIDVGNGFAAIVCSRGARRARNACSIPGCDRKHSRLCDSKTRDDASTCDAKLCDRHAVSDGKDRDLCPAHAQHAVDVDGTLEASRFD